MGTLKIVEIPGSRYRVAAVGARAPEKIDCAVLHSSGFASESEDPLLYRMVKAHFIVLPRGVVVQLYPPETRISASKGLNMSGITVMFMGNFPDERGNWYRGDSFGRHRLSMEQIASGQALLRYLSEKYKLKDVYGFRQASGNHQNNPGPDVWYHVGRWAQQTLGLGGKDLTCGGGTTIPLSWEVLPAERMVACGDKLMDEAHSDMAAAASLGQAQAPLTERQLLFNKALFQEARTLHRPVINVDGAIGHVEFDDPVLDASPDGIPTVLSFDVVMGNERHGYVIEYTGSRVVEDPEGG